MNKSMRYCVNVLAGLFLVVITGCSENSTQTNSSSAPENALGSLQTIEVNIKDQAVTIEVAVSMRAQQQGLMYRDAMPENHGMLFVYDQPRYMSFWMKNTYIPLSIAFLKDDGTIVNIEKMKPQQGPFDPQERYISRERCKYALEMNQGWFEKHGIKAGDKINLPTAEINRMN